MKLYEVGGCVRDSLLGIKSKDIDYAVEAESYSSMRKSLLARGFQIFLETPQFLTIRAKFPDSNVTADFVLCRKDGHSSDGRHPDEVTPGTLYDDLSRRDFTVNAIAKEVTTGRLIDPHNGIQDLQDKILRSVGDPHQRFREDGLRVLRALRFSITKSLTIHPSLWVAILEVDPNLLKGVSADRRREELERLFRADSLRSMRLLNELPPSLVDSFFEGGIWLFPTTKK